jgi:putative thiamine transport system substrate-binding protein
MTMNRRHLLALGLLAPQLPLRAQGDAWARTERAASGQTVYFNAWGGSDRVNAYLQWAAAEVQRQFGIKLEHVKLADTAEAVKRVRAEKAAGRADGSVDMVWINGENFLAMKREGLLYGPFAESLPSFVNVDVQGKPTTRIDFSEPVEGYEAAWGMAQLTFYAESSKVASPPGSAAELLDWAKKNPGRFTYPKPPQFHGTTFVKQVWVELASERAALYQPYTQAALDRLAPPLWAYLDQLHPQLWRAGKQFPPSTTVMRQMLADGELFMALTFNPNEVANQIVAKTLPPTVQSFQFNGGTLGNTHFLAIPFNARARDAALVVINFLQSPAAQARKADIQHWGDPTVLALEKLTLEQRALFGDASKVAGAVHQPRRVIAEPHGSWVDPLEQAWLRRYGTA